MGTKASALGLRIFVGLGLDAGFVAVKTGTC